MVSVVAAAGLTAGPAEAAAAGVVKVYSSTKVEYRAGSGKQNSVTITRSGRTVTVDDIVTVKAGAGCAAVRGDVTKVRCTTGKSPTWLRVYLRDRNDKVTNKTDLGMSAYAGSGNDALTGGPRNDYLYGDDGKDTLTGLGGNDWLGGGHGNDRIHGGAGRDNLDGDEGNDRAYGGPGFDVVDGWEGADLLAGGADNDLVSGGPGRDDIWGNGGDDTFPDAHEQWVSADTFHGGPGDDVVEYDLRTKPVRSDADGVKGDDGRAGEKDTILTDVEDIVGGSGNDVLGGNGARNFLQGGAGNDTIHGRGGPDLVIGGPGTDLLEGDQGDDELHGGSGPDTIRGGTGTDEVSYHDRTGPVTVDLDGATGDDGHAGERDSVGADVERLTGTPKADRLTGNAAANAIDGLGGADIIRGGAGDDRLTGREGASSVFGEAGDDILIGGSYTGSWPYRLDGGPDATGLGDNCAEQGAGAATLVGCERFDPWP